MWNGIISLWCHYFNKQQTIFTSVNHLKLETSTSTHQDINWKQDTCLPYYPAVDRKIRHFVRKYLSTYIHDHALIRANTHEFNHTDWLHFLLLFFHSMSYNQTATALAWISMPERFSVRRFKLIIKTINKSRGQWVIKFYSPFKALNNVS